MLEKYLPFLLLHMTEVAFAVVAFGILFTRMMKDIEIAKAVKEAEEQAKKATTPPAEKSAPVIP